MSRIKYSFLLTSAFVILIPTNAFADPLQGNTERAEMDFPEESTPSHATMQVTPLRSTKELISPIPVPSAYVYDPSKGSLHDYCTSSPDKYQAQALNETAPDADFRGPCAIHDMCYAAVSRGESSQSHCDRQLRDQLKYVCDNTYDQGTENLRQCRGRADVYYLAVANAPHNF